MVGFFLSHELIVDCFISITRDEVGPLVTGVKNSNHRNVDNVAMGCNILVKAIQKGTTFMVVD
jgi:hypothetical protein